MSIDTVHLQVYTKDTVKETHKRKGDFNMKKLANEIKQELLNQTMNFMELDNYMMENGYCSVYDDGIVEYVKDDENVVYQGKDSLDWEIQISFEVDPDDESDDNYTVTITNVVEF